MIRKLLTIFSVISLWAVFSLAPATPAFAQDNSQIVNGLCAGADLRIPDNGAGSGSCNSNGQSISDKINRILKRIVNFLSAIIGVVAVIMIIFGGFRYITSGGSDTTVTSAKNTILYALIGLIIVALAQLLVRFVVRIASS